MISLKLTDKSFNTKIIFSALIVVSLGLIPSSELVYGTMKDGQASPQVHLTISGHISSLQNYEAGNQFMLSGPFSLKISGHNSHIQTEFAMVNVNGTMHHKMILSNFTNPAVQGDRITGRVDIYGKLPGDSELHVVGKSSPVTIGLLKDRNTYTVFTLNIDKESVKGHFGNNPIYGEIIKLKT